MIALTTCAFVPLSPLLVSLKSTSIRPGRSWDVDRYPYSPNTHAMAWAKISGSLGRFSKSRKFSTASARTSSSPSSSSSSSSSSAADPSAMSWVSVWATAAFTLSPASSKTRMIVCTYHALEGANLSAQCVIWPTRSVRKWSSCAAARNASSFCTMNSTLTAFVMRNSRSSVFLFSVSSLSSRQSITAIWWSAAYLGKSVTMAANPLMPMYFRLWLSDRMKRLMEVAAASSSIALGYMDVTVRTTSYTIA
mmetsp:Transcript_19505/g.43463  ORF Transcript_19505/g.43463 Transcript_19505/m.43463 type:complete len:250 (+) Transcript_19505:357-1106(+)